MPSYVPNPFAAGTTAGGSSPYATALRNYVPNKFAGTGSGAAPQMAPHLSQPNPLGEDLTAAYRQALTDPEANRYQQNSVDIDRLWRQSPQNPMFKSGYQHNPYIMKLAEELRVKKLPLEDQEQLYRNSPGYGTYHGE